jgi:TolB-like protein
LNERLGSCKHRLNLVVATPISLSLHDRVFLLRVLCADVLWPTAAAKLDIPTVAQKLNVATILEGSVRKSGKRVRITAQLIEVATDSHLW